MGPKKETTPKGSERSTSGKKEEVSRRDTPIEHFNDGFVVLDAEGTIIYINENKVDPKHDRPNKNHLIGKNAWNEIFSDASQDFLNACQSAANSGRPVFVEEYYQPWERHIISRIYPSPEGLTIFFSDISEKKAIEQELKQMLNLIEESQEIAHFGNWVLDISGETFQWSDEMYRILGVLKENYSPTFDAFMQMVFADDLESLNTWLDQSTAGVKPGAMELRIVRPNGEIRWIRIDGRLAPDKEGEANRIIGFVLDITERRIAQEELWKKQKNIESIIGSSPSIISIIDIEKNDPAYLHYGLKNSLGYTDEQIEAMKGRYAAEITEPGFIETYRNNIQKKYDDLKDGEVIEYECRLKNSKGEWRDIFNREVIFSRNPDGTPAQVISFGTDITSRKKIELEVRENRAFIEKIVESVPNVIFVYDVNKGMPVFTNLGIGGFLGYNDEEIKAMGDNHIQVIMHPDDLARFKIHNYGAYQTLKDEDVLEFDARLRTKDGEWRNFFSKEYVFSRNSDGTVAQIIGIVTDVTESKRYEEEIRQNQAFIESILNASPDIIYLYDVQTRSIRFVNNRIETYLGYTVEEFKELGSHFVELLFHPEDYKHYSEFAHSKYAKLKVNEFIEWEYRLKTKAGKWRWFHSKVTVYSRDSKGNPAQIFGLLTDVDDLVKERKAKQALESRFQIALENIADVITIYGPDKRIRYINSATKTITGLSSDVFIGKKDEEVLPQGIAKIYKEILINTLKKKKIQEVEDTLVFPDGREFFFRITYIPVLDEDGELIEVIGVTQNFSEIKNTERLLIESEERYRLLVNSSPYAMGVIQDEKIVFANPEAIRMFGAKNLDDMLYKHVSDFIIGKQWRDLAKRIDYVLSDEKQIHFIDEEEIAFKEKTSTVEMAVSPILFNEKPAVQVVALDITEKKKNELELENQAIRRQFLIEKSNDGIVIMDVDGKVIEANLRAAEMLGYSQDEFATLSIFDWDKSIPKDELLELLKNADENGIITETVHTSKDGTKKDVEISSTGTIFREKKLIFGVVRDISERKKAEKELADEALRRRLLIEQSRDGIVVIDQNGKVREANLRFAEMLGYSPQETLNLRVRDWDSSIPNSELKKMLRDIDETGDHFETRHKRKDGSEYDVEISTNGAIFDGEKLIFCVCRDITQRKKTESELNKTLEDLRRAVSTTIDALMRTTEIRDPYTAGHQKRVADLSNAIAIEMNISPDLIEGIRVAASIHDIGKISIPSEILSKPFRLTELEYSVVKEHARFGMEILKDVSSPWPLAEIVYQHHEKINGSGYPRGLKGDQIMLEARILCVADVVEAMASHRPYRPSLGIQTALEEIKKQKGILFDKQVVDTCLKLFQDRKYCFET